MKFAAFGLAGDKIARHRFGFREVLLDNSRFYFRKLAGRKTTEEKSEKNNKDKRRGLSQESVYHGSYLNKSGLL